MKYKTRGNKNPQGKPKVYYCCHPEDFELYFDSISNQILAKQNCTVYYSEKTDMENDELFFDSLSQMQLFIVPITHIFLTSDNRALETEFKFAIEKHIPVLPLIREHGIEKLFISKCGDIQFMDENCIDATAIPYDEKLEKYLTSVLIGDLVIEKIRAAFIAQIFLSYRKKDRKYAHELMRLIHRNEFCQDWAIWYDEFLMPGENFNDLIKDAITNSDIFVLTVTPSILEKNVDVDKDGMENENYIVQNEYPLAREKGKLILPVEFVPTDRLMLKKKYEEIPNCVNAQNEVELSSALISAIDKISLKKNDWSPEHSFFIGLAYLSGINVEVDIDRAVSLITSAAEQGLLEAIDRLIDMYFLGMGVERNILVSAKWLEQKVKLLETVLLKTEDNDKKMMLADSYLSLAEHHSGCLEKDKSDIAIEFYKKSLLLYDTVAKTNDVLASEAAINSQKAYRMMAIWYEMHDDFDKALRIYLKLFEIRMKSADSHPDDLLYQKNLILILFDLGIIYSKKGLIKESLRELDKAIELCTPLLDDDIVFMLLYADINTQAATILDTTGEYRSALVYNTCACNVYKKLYFDNKELFNFGYAKTLVNRAIILTHLRHHNIEEIKELYLAAIAIYEKSTNNKNFENSFDHMLAQYKLANTYAREGDYRESAAHYDKCICISVGVEEALKSEETVSQIAIIYLDCATLWFSRNDGERNLEKALYYLNAALKHYTNLCHESRNEYKELFDETQEKINAINAILLKIGEDQNSSISSDSAQSMLKLSKDIQENTENGEMHEQNEHWLQALKCYLAALSALDELENVSGIKCRLARADLCERIGSIQVVYNSYEHAKAFYLIAYKAISEELEETKSDEAFQMRSFIVEKLRSLENA